MKRYAAWFIAVASSVAIVVGCGGSTPNQPKPTQKQAASQQTSGKGQVAKATASTPVKRLEGKPSIPSKSPEQPPKKTTELAKAETNKPPAEGGWGTIKGRVVFGGDKIPEPKKLDVTKDQDHCLSKGPLFDESWVVNPKNKGVRWAVVFLKPAKGKKLAIHPSLQQPPPEAVLDQPQCQFVPHVLILRAGQKLVARNPAPVAHNVVIQGFQNAQNVQIPPGRSHTFELVAESYPVQLSCGIHPWMKGYMWILNHPYYAVTDENGAFEIRMVPSGVQNLVVWHESVGYLGGRAGRNGKPIQIEAGKTTDVGELVLTPRK